MFDLQNLPDLTVLPASIVSTDNAEFGLAWQNGESRLIVLSADSTLLDRVVGERFAHGDRTLLIGATDSHNAAALRHELHWLRPRLLGTQLSAGFGDRLGLATPGHIRALRAVMQNGGGQIAPIFAQQSIREMTRSGRSAQQVIDDALWGVFAEGWQSGFGADADHLKTPVDIDRCLAAGFTFYTIDPGEYVDDRSIAAGNSAIAQAFTDLPWDRLADSPAALIDRYTRHPFDLESTALTIDQAAITRAAVKYGKVVAHVALMVSHLREASADQPFEVEISVDETDSVTSHSEHLYLANEFTRLGVQWISLAPRYVGRFEKGVDYIGDLAAFESDFAIHAEIARRFGGYKLSLHSGSDKFSIYPIAMAQARGRVHLKTAGTSYLEALRTIAASDSALFREIYTFARAHYETDRASYHVSAAVDKAPAPESLADADLPAVIDQFDARQILHVTFGSVLTAHAGDNQPLFRDRLLSDLKADPEAYAHVLETHFIRHLTPFASQPI